MKRQELEGIAKEAAVLKRLNSFTEKRQEQVVERHEKAKEKQKDIDKVVAQSENIVRQKSEHIESRFKQADKRLSLHQRKQK